jgi:hypothetical protein
MAPVVRFAHVERRRMIVDSEPSPRVSLRVTGAEDNLGAARGVLFGVLIGAAIWTGIFLAWFTWN